MLNANRLILKCEGIMKMQDSRRKLLQYTGTTTILVPVRLRVKELVMNTKHIKGTNKGNGFIFTMSDGYMGWVKGLSKAEWDKMERQHGRFTSYNPA